MPASFWLFQAWPHLRAGRGLQIQGKTGLAGRITKKTQMTKHLIFLQTKKSLEDGTSVGDKARPGRVGRDEVTS